MIYDAFTFFNELDLLEIRLHELDPYVDKFVLCESERTFMGAEKLLWFDKNKNRFKKFLPKIVHLVASMSNVSYPRDREQRQREWLIKGVPEDDSHVIMVSDIDEIPEGRKLGEAIDMLDKFDFITLMQHPHFYYVNFMWRKGWHGPVMIRRPKLKERFRGSLHHARFQRRHTKGTVNSGWHFSFMGGVEEVRLKYKSYCHATSIPKEHLRDLENRMNNGIVQTNRGVLECKYYPIEELDLPEWFMQNKEKFKHMILEKK